VLESDDAVDQYRDRIFQELLGRMMNEPATVSPGLQYVLATRHLERIADHATNICEDVIFWVRGLDVRHGRGLLVSAGGGDDGGATTSSRVTENSYERHADSEVNLRD